MVDINTQGLGVAPLSDTQLELLNNAQVELNKQGKIGQEIYLLAVTRE